ncbi:MAG TPA: 16S rRNA (cytidine(1402)-2'-O)-methyltransferase [Candidatus Eremiobacteraceae bacterium]|nr:16S rRNA (cytidine(1402)-2'-O)-methyltransferase [Candidatus Eremiobacteraceae bacterium]
MAGRLYLCATPLGNLEDVTLRVLRVLRECDVVFAEDTRVSSGLLRAYDIDKPLRSFHERVEERRLAELRALLSDGKTVAAVSDAGMPGISDPGVELVRAARSVGATVEALPGPSALLGAVVLSGFDCSRFRFDGFVPRKAGAREKYLLAISSEPACTVVYEAPSRVRALIDDIDRLLTTRRVFVLREYTKKFEQQALGTASEIRAQIEWPARGEFVLAIEGATDDDRAGAVPDAVIASIRELVTAGAGVAVVARALHGATGLPRNALYALAQRAFGRKD